MGSKEEQKIQSKGLIVQSLLYLMRKKSFHEIKITEICKKAGVSRLSYYRNFESKEDIAVRIDFIYKMLSERTEI